MSTLGKFSTEFCWLRWGSTKKLSWPLTSVLWESASCSHHRLCSVAVEGVQWLFIVLHSFFGYDHVFSVFLRPIIMTYFQPYLWLHAFEEQKRFVFVTYLHKHFASYFLFNVLILIWCYRRGGILANIYSLTEWLSPNYDFCLHLQVSDKPGAPDQVRLMREQKHQTRTAIYGIPKKGW